MNKSDIGMIGLAVMGKNLAMNMAGKGFAVSAFDIDAERVKDVDGEKNITGALTLEEFVSQLSSPRRVMMMIRAGKPVDEVIEKLIPLLSPGDIIIDGGNSHFPDTIRRMRYTEQKGVLYIGAGVSGGEEGALLGPSIMPGGSAAAWQYIKPIFQAIAAKAPDGSPCCEWVGGDGAGHFVKMVHNGIEYGDMQLICEAYHLMRDLLGMSASEMHEVFKSWNERELNSYLIEITRDILAVNDEDNTPLVDKILDTAGQKGTGKWTAISALDEGVPLTLIGEAVFSRCLSAIKVERVEASKIIKGTRSKFSGDRQEFIKDLGNALYAAKLVSYAQGFALLRQAAETHNWDLNYGNIALLWRGGCIIRSAFLGKIKEAFDNNPTLTNLLLDPFFRQVMEKSQQGFRNICSSAMLNGVPAPAFASALSYFDGYRCPYLPANLLQAQRDYFGAHTYERTDRPRGEYFHTNWTGRGGSTASTTYNA